MKSIVVSILYIAVCGGLGGVVAWWFAGSVGLAGLPGALVAAAVGMVVAVAAFAGMTTLFRALGWAPK